MADEYNRPQRASIPFGREPAGQAAHSDPLAELARMIGQHDPFTDQARTPRRASPAQMPAHEPQYSEQRHPEQRYAEPPRAEAPSLDWRDEPFSPPPEQAPAGFRTPAQGRGPQYFQQPNHAPAGAPQRAQAQYAQPDYPPRHDAPPFGGEQGNYDQQSYYRDPDTDELYEHAAPKQRGGMIAVMAVLALAVVGTATAFGYRAIFGTSESSPPPVVRADGSPNKVAAASSGEQSKLIYDRVGEKSQTERIVVREEQPVDVKTQPRVIPTTQAAAANPVAPPPAAQLPASASALAPTQQGATSTEPKKVRTVTIRPDQPSMADSPAVRSAMPTPPQAARASSNQVAAIAPADNAPMQVSPVAAAQPAPVRQSAPRAVPAPAPPPVASGNAPLSLTPPSAAPAPSSARMRTASAPATSASASADGGYTVQVSSQRSETEAQASFRSLQSKFPNQLGDRQPLIRRADLGSKGVYFRAQVGPFASQDEAATFCVNLKSAGGQCVVQRN